MSETSIHDINIHETVLRMAERAWQDADDLKAKLLPKANRWLVSGDNEVELHGTEPESARFLQAMLTHPSSDAETTIGRRYHKSGVGYVVAEARLIGFEDVSPDDTLIDLGDVSMGASTEPIS